MGRHVPCTGNPALGWLQPGDAAVVGGHPDAASAVSPDVQGRATCGNYGRRTTAAPAGTPRQVVGIVGTAVDKVIALPSHGQFRRVALAHEHYPGPLQPGYDRRVLIGHEIRPALGPGRSDHPGRLQRILDGYGQAMQRAPALAPRRLPVPLISRCQRPLHIDQYHGVDCGIHLFDTGEVDFGQLFRGDLALSQSINHVPGGLIKQLVHRLSSFHNKRVRHREQGGVGWSGRRDSNPGPHRPERCALPDCATPRAKGGYWAIITV